METEELTQTYASLWSSAWRDELMAEYETSQATLRHWIACENEPEEFI